MSATKPLDPRAETVLALLDRIEEPVACIEVDGLAVTFAPEPVVFLQDSGDEEELLELPPLASGDLN